MLAEILHRVAATEAKEQAFKFRPSSAGPERCVRQIVFKGLGFEEVPRPGRMTMVMDDSSWHEELTADWINKTAYSLHSRQMEIECGPWVSGALTGHIDGVLTGIDGKDYLWEHKALNHFSYNRIEGGTLPWDYLTQCCLYVRGLQKVNPEIDRFILLIKNKNTAAYLEIVGHYDNINDVLAITETINHNGDDLFRLGVDYRKEGILTEAFAKFSYAKECIDKKSLPPRPYPYGTDFPCGYCGYEERCWEGYIENAKSADEITALQVDPAVDVEGAISTLYDQCLNYISLGKKITEDERLRKSAKAAIMYAIRSGQNRKGIEVIWPGVGKVFATITVRKDDVEILNVRAYGKEQK